MRTLKILLTILGAATLSGCASGIGYVDLSYPSKWEKEHDLDEINAEVPGIRKPVVVLIVTDDRKARERVGVSNNLFGAEIFQYLTDGNVENWAHDAIAHELTLRGYKVVRDAEDAEAGEIGELRARVLRIFSDGYMFFHGYATLEATLEEPGEPAFSNEFAAELTSSIKITHDTRAVEYAIAQALQNATLQMLTAFGYSHRAESL